MADSGTAISAIELQITSDAESATKKLDKLASQLKKVKSSLGEVKTSGVEKSAGGVEKIGNAADKATNDLKKLKSELKATTQAGQNIKVLPGLFSAFKDMGGDIKSFAGSIRGLLSPIALVGKGISAAVAHARSFGHAIVKGFQSAASVVKDFAKRLSFSNTALGKLLHTIERVAMLRAIRAALKIVTEGVQEGIENLYRWSDAMNGHFAKSMDSGASAALKFKNSIGAMLSPAIEAVMPLLIQLAEYAIQAANAINQFLNALFGNKTWTRAVDVQTKAYDGLKNTGKAAKEANEKVKNLLADWDELNIIQQKTETNPTSGSGNKNDYPDYTKMFEEVALGKNRWTELGKEIRAEIAAGDWAGVGKTIANQINYAISLIQPKTITDKLNAVIGNALNMANSFLAETQFEELGKKIGGLLQGIFTGEGYLNWGRWGLFLRLRLFAMIRSLKGIVETPGLFSDIGHALANTINTFFDFSQEEKDTMAATIAGSINGIGEGVSSFIKDTDFVSIGQTVNGILMKILSGDGSIHAGQIGDNIRAAVMSAIGFVRVALGTGDDTNVFTELGQKAADLINGLFNFDKAQLETIGSTISGSITGAFDGITTFFDGVDTEQLTTSIVGIIQNLDWLGMADSAIKGASAGLKFVSRLAQSIRESISELKKQLPDVIDSIGKWLISDEGLDTIVDVGKDIGMAIWEGITLALTATETIMKNIIWFAHEIVATIVNEIAGSDIFPHFADANSYQEYVARGENLKGFEHDERGRYFLDTSPSALYEEAAEELDAQLAVLGKTRDEVDEAITELEQKIEDEPWQAQKEGFEIQLETLKNAKQLYEEAAANLETVNQAAAEAADDGLSKMTETVTELTNADPAKNLESTDFDGISESIQVLVTDYGELQNKVESTSTNVVTENQAITDSINEQKVFPAVDDSVLLNGLKDTTYDVKTYVDEMWAMLKTLDSNVAFVPNGHRGGSYRLSAMPLYAYGGFPTTGEMFIARESGPEMVGQIGHGTAVANNDQIVEGVASGVAAGQAEQNALLRQQNQYLLQLLNKPFTAEIGPSRRFAEVSRQSERMLARSTGGA